MTEAMPEIPVGDAGGEVEGLEPSQGTPPQQEEAERLSALTALLRELADEIALVPDDAADDVDLHIALNDAAMTIEDLWNRALVFWCRLEVAYGAVSGKYDQQFKGEEA